MKEKRMFTARKNTIRLVCLTVIFATVVLNSKLLSAVNSPNVEKNAKGEIVIHTSEQMGTINPDIYGLFMEMAFTHFRQGMWAEMLKCRKFAEHDGEDESYGMVKNWYSIGKNNNTYFMHDNTVYYTGTQSQKIISEDAANKRTGIGQGKLYFEKEKSYQIRVNIKQKGITKPVTIALEGENTTYAKKEITITENNWQRFSFTLKPDHTDKDGRLTISFAGTGTLWVGTASLMPDDNISGYRKDVIELLRAIRIPNIRWPGGNFVSAYHWLDGIGDMDKRPPRFNKAWPKEKEWETNDVGIDEFIALCKLLNAKPYIALNSGNGTAEEAANLVQYCNSSVDTKYGKLRAQNGHPKPFNVKLWGIGNEMFGNWQVGHVDEETYARRHLEIANAILVVDKDVKIIAVGGRYWKYPRWNEAIFNIGQGKFDYLSLHSYAKKYRRTLKKEELKDPKLAEETYYYIASSPYGVEEQIIETDKEIKKAFPNRPDITIAFDEWNSFLHRKMDFALRDGIYTAGILHAFRRQHKAVTLANFALVINGLPMIKVNQYGYSLNPAYLVFKMYSDYGGPTLLKSDVKCETFPAPEYEKGRPQAKNQIPYLDVSVTASEDGKKLYVAIINLHADKTVETKISFDKWDFAPDVKSSELYDDDYMTENTFENPNRLTITEDVLKNVNNNFSYNFKPHSVTVMEFQR
jgi:alpha-N-arabinofuranosidase